MMNQIAAVVQISTECEFHKGEVPEGQFLVVGKLLDPISLAEVRSLRESGVKNIKRTWSGTCVGPKPEAEIESSIEIVKNWLRIAAEESGVTIDEWIQWDCRKIPDSM